MKKSSLIGIIVGTIIIVILVLVGAYMQWSSKKTEEGYKIETRFVETEGFISLAITPFGFRKDDYALVLIDEKGDAIGTNYLLKEHFTRGEIIEGETTREIKMTSLSYRTPMGRRFFLLVKKEGMPDPIFRKELEFAGSKLSIVSLEGSDYRQTTETINRTIKKLCLELRNSGDMPVWITSVELEIADRTATMKLVRPIIMMPGEIEILEFTDVRDNYKKKIALPLGEQSLKIKLYDGGDREIGECQTTWLITVVPPAAPTPTPVPCTAWDQLFASLLRLCTVCGT